MLALDWFARIDKVETVTFSIMANVTTIPIKNVLFKKYHLWEKLYKTSISLKHFLKWR